MLVARILPALLVTALAGASFAQAPAPRATAEAPARLALLLREGRTHLEREDPVRALAAFRSLQVVAPDDPDVLLGLAATHLFAGAPERARPFIEAVRRADPDRQDAIALHVRILIRAAEFERALRMSTRAVRAAERPSAELLAAHASALFRVQRTVDAAGVYQQVLLLEPMCAEAHLRLGSGLLSPCRPPFLAELGAGIRLLRAGDLDGAQRALRAALRVHPGHPIAHRLLGEALYTQRYLTSMANHARCYRELGAALPVPDVSDLPLSQFFPGWSELGAERRKVAARALRLFASRLPRLVTMRARHDLLLEAERTTDASARAGLRGKRTFDGRVWDDVRGIGGLQAATGIEALDEAGQFGFDTLAHEIAHQAHLYAFSPLLRAKIHRLYEEAKAAGRCLDFYAASNDAEYFGQGVEAFSALGKRPGCEKTHGHTRFELMRVDPQLHDLIASLVDFDPLRDPALRAKLLPLAVEVALASGRPDDAAVAARMMAAGVARDQLLVRVRRAAAE
ncbi:MAG: tetratricopeptide repeat protein [Planctomycetes bacterium]|nr:tetratricopeptide repeat protein [Planctomycetota bacterium]